MKDLLLTGLLLLSFVARPQLKLLIEDFEGLGDNASEIKMNGLFTFGCINAQTDHSKPDKKGYLGQRAMKFEKNGRETFGGWGKGVNHFVELHFMEDHINFFLYATTPSVLKIEIQEDDDGDAGYRKEKDDSWTCTEKVAGSGRWELISVPLTKFRDGNKGGDGIFNVNYKGGRLLCVIITVEDVAQIQDHAAWYFDFLCFSKGALPIGDSPTDPPQGGAQPCSLGAWSKEGNSADFTDIATAFEDYFKGSEKKLGVVHFFQPFSVEGGGAQYHYPSVDRINKVVLAGYIPMITLEDHFVNTNAGARQPNLYSIVEGHFDSFLGYWAHHIKQVKGTVLLRILHEFNGDWYPWCTVNNDRDPFLVAKAFRYIHNIFKENNVTNVKFIWCPNSLSSPQESWNFIMDAYPGDEYVDFVALDVYNGAGDGALWRSFRKEASENYFMLTQKLPNKPLLICETASRERRVGEHGQNKGEWIRQMSEALKSDMSKFRLLAWFDEKETFKVNSSPGSKEAFNKYIVQDPYFAPGTKYMVNLLEKK
jgi:hypothetical protein